MVNEGKKLFQLFEGQFTMTNLHQAGLPTVRVEFYAISQGEKETVLAYTSRVDIIVATLAKLGERVSTGAWICALGNGLRDEYNESKDGIFYNKPGFENVRSVKTKLLSEEAVITSKSKKAKDQTRATKEKDDEIAPKLQDFQLSQDTKSKELKEPKDKLLMLKGKGDKGQPKGKGNAKGRNTWGDSDQWQNQWSPHETSSTAPYANWTQPAKGKGYGRTKVDPSTLWCDIHQVFLCVSVSLCACVCLLYVSSVLSMCVSCVCVCVWVCCVGVFYVCLCQNLGASNQTGYKQDKTRNTVNRC
jgi:hypothetical protein